MSHAGRDSDLPLTFRESLLRRLTATLRAGECCSLVAGSGFGKTNLIRFLLRPDVQAAYWGDRPVWVILIDSNALAVGDGGGEFALLELLAHRLVREAEDRALAGPLLAELDRLHSALIEQRSTLLALRHLERMVARVIAATDAQLAVIFDEFDPVWQRLDARLFLNLRYLRDEFKYRLVYLALTRESLQRSRRRARGDAAEVEAFWELFDPHRFGLGPYSPADAQAMIEGIARRRGVPVNPECAELALNASGGHPALLRAIYWTLERGYDPRAAGGLAGAPAVAAECAKLWESLLPEEQRAVRRLALRGATVAEDAAAVAELRLKEILAGEPPALFAPVFAASLRELGEGEGEGVVVDALARTVWVEGRRVEQSLTPLEFELLAYLAAHAGQVCKREAILEALYPDGSLDANDERIDTLLRRLRDALGEDGRSPRHLITHRGVGVRLARGRIER
jgi:hypothetical protein